MAFDIDRAAVLKQIFQRTRILFVSAVIGHDGFAEFLADEHQFRFFIPLRLHLDVKDALIFSGVRGGSGAVGRELRDDGACLVSS